MSLKIIGKIVQIQKSPHERLRTKGCAASARKI
jgi:hypothetical protein